MFAQQHADTARGCIAVNLETTHILRRLPIDRMRLGRRFLILLVHQLRSDDA